MRRLVALVVAVAAVGGCASAGTDPQLSVGPPGALDTAPPISASGLTPGETVRLRVSMPDRTGARWTSEANLRADSAGRVDTAGSASAGGTYRGVDVTGPYRSMRPAPDVPATYPLVDTPVLDADVELLRGDDVVARGAVRRGGAGPAAPVTRQPVMEAGLVGDLYLPAGPGPHPGVLLLGGSEGGRPTPTFATMLAARGYVVLGLAYFGAPGLPPAIDRIPLEYGLAAADFLAGRPEVGGAPIGLHGTSKGAEYALLLASERPRRFAAVAALVPSDVAWPRMAFRPGEPPHSSWSRGGRDVPFLVPRMPSPPSSPPTLAPSPGGAFRVAAAYQGMWDAATPAERATARIPVERIAAPVLVVSAGDDGIWPSRPQAERVASSIRAAGDRSGVRLLHHPAAGHFVGGVPHLPTTVSRTGSAPFPIESGGTPAATARARQATWDATVALFDRALSPPR